MKYIFIAGGFLFALTLAIYLQTHKPSSVQNKKIVSQTPTSTSQTDAAQSTIIAENLDTPWAIAFLPDTSLLVTERSGRVRFISADGVLDLNPIVTINSVKEIGEGGLLGVTLHPDFTSNHFVYFYYTFTSQGSDTLNRVVRMTYSDKKLTDEKIIVDNIPGASNHNGGRIKFGPDTMLYIGTGDAEEPSRAQDKNSLAGKILRVTADGKAAPGNPFGNQVFSMGHRNVQGLAWNKDGILWETEHGPSGLGSGFDEVNLIQSGKNYGWSIIQGDKTKVGMETPKKNSGATTTWAPSGAAFIDNSLFFSGLRGQGLYEAVIVNDNVTEIKKHLDGEFGRIREVIVGPDGMLYITTSNKDGRGIPGASDDKVIKINPQKL